jgi:hypothetical protein
VNRIPLDSYGLYTVRFVSSSLTLILVATTALSSQESADSVHRFETYAVSDTFRGKPVPVDLTSAPHARRFATVLRQGAASGPNFGGHFTIVTWGCGTSCEQLAIVDAASGRVWFYNRTLEVGAQFRLGSALLVDGPPEDWYSAWESVRLPNRAFTFYYRWTGHRFELIDSVRVPPKRP